MLVKGDITCLHCGFVSGQWTGVNGSPVTFAGYKAPEAEGAEGNRESPESPVRCARCDGPVYLEDVEPVVSSQRLRRILRLRKQLAALDARDAA